MCGFALVGYHAADVGLEGEGHGGHTWKGGSGIGMGRVGRSAGFWGDCGVKGGKAGVAQAVLLVRGVALAFEAGPRNVPGRRKYVPRARGWWGRVRGSDVGGPCKSEARSLVQRKLELCWRQRVISRQLIS